MREYLSKWHDEIIDMVMFTSEEEQHNSNDKLSKKSTVIAPFLLGLIYVILGISLFIGGKWKNSLVIESSRMILGVELLAIGIYSLLFVAIFLCQCKKWKKKGVQTVVKNALIIMMTPFYLCNKLIKTILKNTRQEYVSQFYPYYFVSLFLVMCTYLFYVEIFARLRINEAYIGVISFGIAVLLVIEFWGISKILVYFITWSINNSVQKSELKRELPQQWKKKYKEDNNKLKRKELFHKKWIVIKEELEYTKIYFYIILTVSILCMPKESGSFGELLSNQFLGIITITALARESKLKKGEQHKKKMKHEIKMFLTDCDGCLTDGGMYYSENGDELKKFNTKDGMGFSFLKKKGIITGIITGEDVRLNYRRVMKLQLDILESGCIDKLATVKNLCEKYHISLDEVVYIGDDVNDLDVIKNVGYGCCPADAVSVVRQAAKFVTDAKGGEGAIREVIDVLLEN